MADAPQVSANEALRLRRLAFYAEDIEQFNTTLVNFLKKSAARSVLLIDKEGHLVAKQGFLQKLDSAALGALVSGSFASTREVAKLLGEPEFRVQFHQGTTHSTHISLVGDRTLQVIVFDSKVMPGMIGVLAKELASKVEEILKGIANRPEKAEAQEQMAQFSDEMKSQLDNLFGDL